MRKLIALALPGGQAFVDELRRIWDDSDAALPVDRRLPLAAQRRLCAQMGAAAVVNAHGRSRLDGVGVPVGDTDALVVATSGSTGDPKGVVLPHDALAASAQATSAALEVCPARDRWLACLPLAHVGGLSVVVRALHTGTPLEVHDGFDAEAAADAARRGCTLVSLVPTALARLDASLFRRILLGGSAMPAERPAHTVATYGLTETGSGVVYEGWPLDGVEIRIVAADGSVTAQCDSSGPCRTGESDAAVVARSGEPVAVHADWVGNATAVGEIQLRGPMLLRCYRNGADPRVADGWLPTGDSGSLSAAGQLTVQGRIGDMIVTGGENVWPAAVERVLAALPEVAAVAVVGRPDPEWGQRVTAVVVPAPGRPTPTLDALRDAAKAELAAYCAPRAVEIVAALPVTALGKTQRHRLRPS